MKKDLNWSAMAINKNKVDQKLNNSVVTFVYNQLYILHSRTETKIGSISSNNQKMLHGWLESDTRNS